MDDQVRHDYDLGTWGFLQAGWWVLHIAAIIGVFYLGYLWGPALFGMR